MIGEQCFSVFEFYIPIALAEEFEQAAGVQAPADFANIEKSVMRVAAVVILVKVEARSFIKGGPWCYF